MEPTVRTISATVRDLEAMVAHAMCAMVISGDVRKTIDEARRVFWIAANGFEKPFGQRALFVQECLREGMRIRCEVAA